MNYKNRKIIDKIAESGRDTKTKFTNETRNIIKINSRVPEKVNRDSLNYDEKVRAAEKTKPFKGEWYMYERDTVESFLNRRLSPIDVSSKDMSKVIAVFNKFSEFLSEGILSFKSYVNPNFIERFSVIKMLTIDADRRPNDVVKKRAMVSGLMSDIGLHESIIGSCFLKHRTSVYNTIKLHQDLIDTDPLYYRSASIIASTLPSEYASILVYSSPNELNTSNYIEVLRNVRDSAQDTIDTLETIRENAKEKIRSDMEACVSKYEKNNNTSFMKWFKGR